MGALPLPVAVSTPSVLVIRVSFSSLAVAAPKSATDALFLQVRNYYRENSYDTFFPTFTVTDGGGGGQGSYLLGQPLSFYGSNSCGTVFCGLGALFDDAAAAANAAGVDFSRFDHVMVMHAGNGEESSGAANDIWSLFLDQPRTLDGRSFGGFTVVPESQTGGFSPHSVICHEYGHQLGLPDLYDTRARRSTMGLWDVMDYPYGGASPSQTPHLGAWSKAFLGFAAPFASSGTVTFPPNAEASSRFLGVNRVAVPASNESFYMEYRSTGAASAFDKAQPVPSGLAVWHVDESLVLGGGSVVLNNVVNAPPLNGRSYRAVDLVEADGIPANPPGDLGANDLFTNGTALTGGMSNGFSGLSTGMTVVVTGGAGTPMLTAQVVYFRAAPTQTITRVVNYPNPGGDRSRFPVRAGAPTGTITTLVVRLSRPVTTDKIRVDVYSLDGERVRSISGRAFVLKVGADEPTADEKWVYEYDWDGKGDGGEDLAGGVYMMRVEAGGETEKGKLMIVR